MKKRRENLIVFRLKRNYAWSMSFLHTYLCKLVLAVFFLLQMWTIIHMWPTTSELIAAEKKSHLQLENNNKHTSCVYVWIVGRFVCAKIHQRKRKFIQCCRKCVGFYIVSVDQTFSHKHCIYSFSTHGCRLSLSLFHWASVVETLF